MFVDNVEAIDERRQSVEHTEQGVPSKTKCQLRVETNTVQAGDERREQKPTYDVRREGVITTACDSTLPIYDSMARIRVHHYIRLERVIASELPESPQSGQVGQ